METYLIIIFSFVGVGVIFALVISYSKKSQERKSNITQELSQNRASLIANSYLSNGQKQDKNSKIQFIQKSNTNPDQLVITIPKEQGQKQIPQQKPVVPLSKPASLSKSTSLSKLSDEKISETTQNFYNSLKKLKKPFLLLIGQSGMHKTQIFNDLIYKAKLSKEQCRTWNDFTFAEFAEFILVDTPPFELDDDIDKRELIIKQFQPVFYELRELIVALFIVCKFERTDIMKQNIMSVYKYVQKFGDKIQIIVSDFHLSKVSQDKVHIQSKFKLFLKNQSEVIFYCQDQTDFSNQLKQNENEMNEDMKLPQNQESQQDTKKHCLELLVNKSTQQMINSDLSDLSPDQTDQANHLKKIENVKQENIKLPKNLEMKAESENETNIDGESSHNNNFNYCLVQNDALSQNSENDHCNQQLICQQTPNFLEKNETIIFIDQQTDMKFQELELNQKSVQIVSDIQFSDKQQQGFNQKFFQVFEQIVKQPQKQLNLEDTIFEKFSEKEGYQQICEALEKQFGVYK